MLGKLGGVENHIHLRFAGRTVTAMPEHDVDRTRDDGKVSSVLFLHFPFTADDVAAFRTTAEPVMFVIDHPEYGHIALLPDAVRLELAGDFA